MLLCPALLLCSSIWLGLRLCAGFSNQDYLTLSLQSLTPPRAVALPYSHADSADLSSTQLFLLAAGCAAGPSPVSPLLFWFVDSWMLLQIHRICRVSKRLQTSGREHLLDLEIVIASAAGEGSYGACSLAFEARNELQQRGEQARYPVAQPRCLLRPWTRGT